MSDEPVKETVTEPEKVHPAPEVTPPPVDPPHADNSVKELVDGLAERVSGLEELVRGLSPAEQDTKPHGVPWTHRGGR